LVEESVTRFAFESYAPRVSIRNVVVEKYASPAQVGAINGMRGANWKVEDCEARFNSGAGIGLGNGGQILNSNLHHNGQIGAVMVGKNIALKGNMLWANNVSNYDFIWEAGGIKIAEADGVYIAQNYVHDNIGPGLWCDINCRNVLYEGNTVENNLDAGIYHEISFDAVIRNNTLRHNGRVKPSWCWGSDILISASEHVEVYANTITTKPGGCAITLIDQSRARSGLGKYKTMHNYIHHNKITFDGYGQAGGASDAPVGDENFAIISGGGNLFDYNIYRTALSGSSVTFHWGHEIYDWLSFRQNARQEPNGQLIVPVPSLPAEAQSGDAAKK
jgi:parallel beta-helix repeat protein